MTALVSAISSNIMDLDTLTFKILFKCKAIAPDVNFYFKDNVLKPNLSVIIKHKDLIIITNIINAAIIYKQLYPTRRFSNLVLNYILKNNLPIFYLIFYLFFDTLSINERKNFGFDINLFSEIFTPGTISFNSQNI